jgi:polyisoprenyl-teichoic acid--peptidoglycan teichoic acid transferase
MTASTFRSSARHGASNIGPRQRALRHLSVGVLLATTAIVTAPQALAGQIIPTVPQATTATTVKPSASPVPAGTAPTETVPAATVPAATVPAATVPAATTPAATVQPTTASKAPSTLAARTATTKPSKGATTKPTKGTTTAAKAPAKVSKRNAKGQYSPNGKPVGAAIAFSPTPGSLDKSTPSAANEAEAFKAIQSDGKPLFIVIIGSDARPGEKVDRSRSDAVHLFAYNPTLKAGTMIGFPRDSYVTPPGAAQRKLSGVMSTQGPDAVVKTISTLMGVPVTRFVVTGFEGFTKMVDEIGGIPLEVNPAMNDKASGAQFQQGWFQMNGEAALAFNRARKTLPKGDFSRSANQEKFILATLAKLRATTGNISSLTTWVNSGRKHTITNIKAGDWMYFAQVARSIEPGRIKTMVVPGVPKTIKGESVVQLDAAKLPALSKDLADGVLGN